MIQIDIPMPKNCHDCPCVTFDDILDEIKCYMTNDICVIPEETAKKGRLNNCPLKDVPETNAGKWISVKDRLPESMVNKVLVWLEHEDLVGYIGFAHFEKYQGLEMWYDLEHQEQFAKRGYTVTHWMSLPEPPKEEGTK